MNQPAFAASAAAGFAVAAGFGADVECAGFAFAAVAIVAVEVAIAGMYCYHWRQLVETAAAGRPAVAFESAADAAVVEATDAASAVVECLNNKMIIISFDQKHGKKVRRSDLTC